MPETKPRRDVSTLRDGLEAEMPRPRPHTCLLQTELSGVRPLDYMYTLFAVVLLTYVQVRHGLTMLSQRILGPNTIIQGAVKTILTNTPGHFFDTAISLIQVRPKIFCAFVAVGEKIGTERIFISAKCERSENWRRL